MAQIVFTIPDAQLARVIDAMSNYYGWTTDLGIARGAFVKQQFVKILTDVLREAEINQALANARATTSAAFVDPSIT